MQCNRLLVLEAGVEFVALQHLRNGKLRRQSNHSLKTKLVQPFGVEPHLCLLTVQNFEHLLCIGFGIPIDLFARQRLARDGAPAGVADQAGEVSNEENDRVAEVLKMFQLADQHRMTQVKVRRGRVKSCFDAQRLAGGAGVLQASAELGRRNNFRRAFLQIFQLFFYRSKIGHDGTQYKECMGFFLVRGEL